MLYVGENYDRITMVNGGKVVWTYDTAPGYELDDVWMLSNGNILYSHMTFVEEITPQKQVVWHYVPTNGEVHSVQPIGLDKVLFFENALPMGRVRLYNKKTSTFEVDQTVPRFRPEGQPARRGPSHPHDRAGNVCDRVHGLGPSRRVRQRLQHPLDVHDRAAVVSRPSEEREYPDPRRNAERDDGSQSERSNRLATREIGFHASLGNDDGKHAELRAPIERQHGHVRKRGDERKQHPGRRGHAAKQVVWMLQDWMHLGDATSAQFLDEPGYPEIPGDTNH